MNAVFRKFDDRLLIYLDKIYFRKDVRLPVHLQRAMAAEAEAAREARAKVDSWEKCVNQTVNWTLLMQYQIS